MVPRWDQICQTAVETGIQYWEGNHWLNCRSACKMRTVETGVKTEPKAPARCSGHENGRDRGQDRAKGSSMLLWAASAVVSVTHESCHRHWETSGQLEESCQQHWETSGQLEESKTEFSWCGVQCESFASAPASRPLGTCEEKQCEYSHGSCQSLEKPG